MRFTWSNFTFNIEDFLCVQRTYHRTYHMSDEFKEKMDTGLSKSYHLDFFINPIVLDFYWSDPPKSLEMRTFNIFLQ